MKLHHTYKGCVITRNTSPGYSLRWFAHTPQGRVSADTLAGIKRLISENLKK